MGQSRHIRCGRAVDVRDSVRTNAPEQVQHSFMTDLHRSITDAVLSGETPEERRVSAQRLAAFAFAALVSRDGVESANRAACLLAATTAGAGHD